MERMNFFSCTNQWIKISPYLTPSTNEWQLYHQLQPAVRESINSQTFKGGRKGKRLQQNSSVCAMWHWSAGNVYATPQHMLWFGKNCSVYTICHRCNLIRFLTICTSNGYYLKQAVSPDLHLCPVARSHSHHFSYWQSLYNTKASIICLLLLLTLIHSQPQYWSSLLYEVRQ
jgi:hypothetical protein